jgi:uncharacterized membrane protein
MPDEFPTLEVVAALATLVALVRGAQLVAALGEVRRLSDAMASALRTGDREAARRVVTQSEGRAFSSVARALLDALAHPETLARSVKHASVRVQRQSRRSSASGAFVGLLLVGLLLYTFVARLSPTPHAAPSSLFDVLVVVGVVVHGVGIVLNQRVSRETRRAARRLGDAAPTGDKELV